MDHLAGRAGLQPGLVVIPANGRQNAGVGRRLVIADADQYFMVGSQSLSYCSGREKQQYWSESLFVRIDTDAELADLLPAHIVMQRFTAIGRGTVHWRDQH